MLMAAGSGGRAFTADAPTIPAAGNIRRNPPRLIVREHGIKYVQ
jgi:hypothetical protein